MRNQKCTSKNSQKWACMSTNKMDLVFSPLLEGKECLYVKFFIIYITDLIYLGCGTINLS